MSSGAPPPPPGNASASAPAGRRRWTRTARFLLWILAGLTGLLLLLGLAALIVLPSSWFREKVRERLVAQVEEATGGRVEIGAFSFDWSSLTAEVAPFVLHGTEPAKEAPLFRAESVKVGLRIISMLQRDVDISSLGVEQPRVNLLVNETGITNLPVPKTIRKSEKSPMEQILSLAIRDVNLRNGEVHYGDRKLPLDVRGRYLSARLFYDSNGPAYQGALTIQEAAASGHTPMPIHFSVDTKFRLLKNRLELQPSRIGLKESSVQISGTVDDFQSPRIAADVIANAFVSEFGPILKLPLPHVGQANFTGKVTYDPISLSRVKGRLTGQHFALVRGRVNLQNVSLASDVDLQNRDLRLRDLTVHALDGVFRGAVDVVDFTAYRVNGQLGGVSIPSVMRTAGLKRADFAGTVSGPLELTGSMTTGSRDVKAGAKLSIAARQGGVPVKGFVDIAYTQRRNTMQLGQSWIELPHTRLDVRGTVGEQLTVRLDSRDLNDLEPAAALAVALASGDAPGKLPVQLAAGGSALFEGVMTGPVDRADVAGTLTLTSFEVEQQGLGKQRIDRLVATLNATPMNAHVSAFALAQGTLRLSGNADVALRQWKTTDASSVSANVKVEGAEIATLLKQAKQNVPAEGMASAEAAVTGTIGGPLATLRINVDKPVFYGERFDRFSAELRYAGTGVEVLNGVMTAGDNRVLLAGTYRHPALDLKNGQLEFSIATEGWSLQEIRNLEKRRPGLTGRVRVKLAGNASVKNAEVLPQSVDGQVSLRGLGVDTRQVGDVRIDAHTSGQQLTLSLAGNVRGSAVTGKGLFQLSGEYPGSGEVTLAPIPFRTVHDLFAATQSKAPLPVEGTIEAHATFSGPAKQPETMHARIEIPQVVVAPARNTFTRKQRTELSFRNDGPIVVEYDGKAANVRSAHLVGPETDLRAAGAIFVREKSVADLKIDGSLNLGVLQSFDSNIVSSGSAAVSASVRGTLRDPQLNGRMEFRNASLYMTDFPNGLDNLNGTIVFDQRRATIERLRANTGGGDLQLSGFVGFGRDEMLYRLQARADHVRLRYPEGVSATASATLSLTGTSARSLLAGVVTLTRAGFNPKSDVGGLLASAPTPVAVATTGSDYLRNMNLDIRVDTTPNLQFQTSLTANIQADAELRIRGTGAKPAVLGRVVVSQGEMEFFGNKYTITRGEIGFFNPVRIEPVLDVNVETKARGVDVSISLSGTLKKLNFSYRSDPPLQSNEIIALLAMGRAPGSNSSLASSQTVSSSSALATGTNSLLGQTVANPVSNRLQRFFGVSRLKIDPQLTGISAVPQARLTIEQQVSRDITLTYVTNLAQANQQIIRLEWNLSRTWSVVAVREENGVFGVDFFFKTRIR